LLEAGRHVAGLDDLNSYYDPALKQARLDLLEKSSASRHGKVVRNRRISCD
jgi:hypothetical protein